MSNKLGIGADFPKMTLQIVGGGSMTLPNDLTSPYSMVLFYRGHW